MRTIPSLGEQLNKRSTCTTGWLRDTKGGNENNTSVILPVVWLSFVIFTGNEKRKTKKTRQLNTCTTGLLRDTKGGNKNNTPVKLPVAWLSFVIFTGNEKRKTKKKTPQLNQTITTKKRNGLKHNNEINTSNFRTETPYQFILGNVTLITNETGRSVFKAMHELSIRHPSKLSFLRWMQIFTIFNVKNACTKRHACYAQSVTLASSRTKDTMQMIPLQQNPNRSRISSSLLHKSNIPYFFFTCQL